MERSDVTFTIAPAVETHPEPTYRFSIDVDTSDANAVLEALRKLVRDIDTSKSYVVNVATESKATVFRGTLNSDGRWQGLHIQ